MFNNCSKRYNMGKTVFEIRKSRTGKKWKHIKSKKRNLTISLESSNNTNHDTSFTYF
ncbi:MAG: hypothetical protein L6V81_08270 [Clostridium sp.]|nr:MAG: hypothetical protein L6V81_08270 [Clostridium sp.]